MPQILHNNQSVNIMVQLSLIHTSLLESDKNIGLFYISDCVLDIVSCCQLNVSKETMHGGMATTLLEIRLQQVESELLPNVHH